MPAFLIPLGIAAASAIGGFFNNRKKKSTEDTEFERSGTSTTTPVTSPEFDELSQELIQRILTSKDPSVDLEGILASLDQLQNAGLEQVNQLSERISNQIQGRLTGQGLGESTISGFGEGVAGGVRAGALSNLLAEMARLRTDTALTVPQVMSNIQAQRARSGSDLLRSLPIGSETVREESGTSKGIQVSPGNALGGFFSDLGGGIATGSLLNKLPSPDSVFSKTSFDPTKFIPRIF